MGRATYTAMTVITYIFLGALLVTVGAVLLVIVGPILLEIDILAHPTYTRIEVFLRRMLLYIVISATGYVVASWGRRLSEPRSSSAATTPTVSRPKPSPGRDQQTSRVPGSPEGSGSQATRPTAYRPEVVPPTHP